MEEILAKIGFDYRIALANLVNFLIVFWLLYTFVFPKVQKVLTQRQAEIHKGLRDAEDAARMKVNAEKDAQATRDIAHGEAREIIAEGEKEKESIIAHAQEIGKSEKDLLVASAQKVINAEKTKAQQEVKLKGQALVNKAVKNLFKNDVSDADHDKYAQKVATYFND